MEGEKYRCQGCGSEIPSNLINFKTRHATCPWCGLEIVFPKRHSTASPNAQIAIEEAYNLFMIDNFDSSLKCAEHALTMVNTSIVATFIVDYYKSFVASIKNTKSIDLFFKTKLQDFEFEIEEEEMFKNMLYKKALKVSIYEEEILAKFEEYDDPKELQEFVEKFSPILISKREDFNWLTEHMVDVYKRITKRVPIPKTWYALYSSAVKNPESPLQNGLFYLKTKTDRIYKDCIIPIGEILDLIKEENYKEKFSKGYLKIKTVYENKMKNS